MSALGLFLSRLFSLETTTISGLNLISAYFPLLAVACAAATPLVKHAFMAAEDMKWVGWARVAAAALSLVLCVAALASQSYNPFIYFRF